MLDKIISKHGQSISSHGDFTQKGRFSLLADDIQPIKLLALIVQLAIVFLSIRIYNIEGSSAIHALLPLIFGGFIIHAVIDHAFRLPFFVFLSISAIFVVFGLIHGSILTGIALGLIGLCHLPVSFKLRVGLILLAVTGLVVLRGGWIETTWANLVLPILGAMFMFRLVIYVHDIRHERVPATIWERLAYFFLLPNVAFPLFPVIDYQLFRKSYYNEDAHRIYQKGVLWIFRGVTHLILYRVVYYYLVPTPEEVQGLGQFVLFILSSYLIYLRVSGLFHVIIGILCLFGMNLPETHHHYFLASEFNEVWRKLNIYWKDFMAKILYYPLVMKIRGWGMMRARVVGTMMVFVATWLLHSYQWFWLRGSFPLKAIDGLYWGVLGMFVVINTIRTTKNLSPKDDEQQGWSWMTASRKAFGIMGIFLFMSVLWSFWSSTSISGWWAIMKVGASGSPQEYGLLVAGLVTVFLLLLVHLFMDYRGVSLLWDEKKMSFGSVALRTGIAALLLTGIGLRSVHNHLGEQTASFISSIREVRLNEKDQIRHERGYYEDLIDGNSYTALTGSWSQNYLQPDNWKATKNSDAVQLGEGIITYELIPEYSGTIKEAPFSVNKWGMRDKEYEKERTPGTYRIAFMGASYGQGAGVPNERIFPALLENLLNERQTNGTYDHYEVLNFAVGGYSPVQSLYLMENVAIEFEPDAFLYEIHSTESRRLQNQLQQLATDERDVPYDFLKQAITQSGVTAETDPEEARRRLDPFLLDIIDNSFERMGAFSESVDIPIIGLFVPSTQETEQYNPELHPPLKKFAEEAGFIVLTMHNVYPGATQEELYLAPWDTHPNEKAHKLISEAIYKTLLDHDSLLQMGLSDLN